ncbi:hypothetical protein CfE428DRAFT_3978 [Chthoniobacter flavus Ellin428]|uniref:Uncharacterized protein n=1 Tax=Chthoniobacter flavus Ellin428 TaxID=497964 RepID=B4D4Z0_9BACT|nr:hypothetical protein [Chthoniobacter flavus]EDY18593.1 hypothetical protein CfE428DRAFT_3978 [Chthoniobacter flavus Ellin428]TCO90951.1 hypothetical protein EV701_109101 [Chthoniobacter flavus]
MLALSSLQWKEFGSFTGNAEELPADLRSWQAAIGTSDEEGEWGWLRDQFLCQHTIQDSAIAIVPHICGLLSTTAPALQHYYAIDLGQVHMAWRRSPIVSISPELVATYEAAIVSIRPWSCACLARSLAPIDFRYLLSACAALCEHPGLGRFLFSLDSSTDEFPDSVGYI